MSLDVDHYHVNIFDNDSIKNLNSLTMEEAHEKNLSW